MSVYFITCRELGTVKIGVARDVGSRLSSLQTAAAAVLSLEATLPGYIAEERALHERFAHLRLRGEWFQLTGEIEAFIAETGLQVEPEDVAAPRRSPSIEELVEESLRKERETYAECMAWRARADAGQFEGAAA